MIISNRQKKRQREALLPRCLAAVQEHVCTRHLGHGNGWNGDKHSDGLFSWTDAYARKIQDEKAKAIE